MVYIIYYNIFILYYNGSKYIIIVNMVCYMVLLTRDVISCFYVFVDHAASFPQGDGGVGDRDI